MLKQRKQRKTSIKPSKRSLEASKLVQNKMWFDIYTSSWCKPIPKGDVATNEANHVPGLPLIVSTRRVELITSKATVLDEASVLAKSRSEEGS